MFSRIVIKFYSQNCTLVCTHFTDRYKTFKIEIKAYVSMLILKP